MDFRTSGRSVRGLLSGCVAGLHRPARKPGLGSWMYRGTAGGAGHGLEGDGRNAAGSPDSGFLHGSPRSRTAVVLASTSSRVDSLCSGDLVPVVEGSGAAGSWCGSHLLGGIC